MPTFTGSSSYNHGMVPSNTRGLLSLPSGLGAGGRGKEKAPCRYLHYEVDWDGGDGEWKREGGRVKKIHKLDIGLGPAGKEARVVGLLVCPRLCRADWFSIEASSSMDQL